MCALFFRRPQIVTATDTEEGSWIRTFSRVQGVSWMWTARSIGFHPCTLKSLRMHSIMLPHSQIFDVVRSPLLLGDLASIVHGIANNDDLYVNPSLGGLVLVPL